MNRVSSSRPMRDRNVRPAKKKPEFYHSVVPLSPKGGYSLQGSDQDQPYECFTGDNTSSVPDDESLLLLPSNGVGGSLLFWCCVGGKFGKMTSSKPYVDQVEGCMEGQKEDKDNHSSQCAHSQDRKPVCSDAQDKIEDAVDTFLGQTD
eukprot:6055090-Amphidinium_carterae.1